MRLSDSILAARGSPFDLMGFATSLGRQIEKAERFELADEVVFSVGELVRSRPSSLLAALPLCRLPYEKTWIEFRGGQGPRQEEGKTFNDLAPVPARQGTLVESMPGGQIGMMSFAWVHRESDKVAEGVNMTPVSIFFDWRADGNVRDVVATAHDALMAKYAKHPGRMHDLINAYAERLERSYWDNSPEDIARLLAGSTVWNQFTHDKREIEALRELDRHMLPGLSPHGIEMAAFIISRNHSSDVIRAFLSRWEADVHGEGTFVQAFLAMLNSRNAVVEHERVDVTRLNKSRRKNGRSEFLTYSKTRLAMSRSQARIATARGVPHETARQHLVRGHFKIRTSKKGSGVYWWSPFLRGDPKKGTVERRTYEVNR